MVDESERHRERERERERERRLFVFVRVSDSVWISQKQSLGPFYILPLYRVRVGLGEGLFLEFG